MCFCGNDRYDLDVGYHSRSFRQYKFGLMLAAAKTDISLLDLEDNHRD